MNDCCAVVIVTYPCLPNPYCVLPVLAEGFAPIMHQTAVIVRASKRINSGSTILQKITVLT